MRKKLMAIIAGAALSASVLAVTAAPVSAGLGEEEETPITVEVTKEVVNAPEQETSFTIKLACTDEDGDTETETQVVDWRKPGNSSWKLLPGTFELTVYHEWDGDVTCVVTETATGGAVTTTITCDEDDYGAVCDGASLYIDEDAREDAAEEEDSQFGEFTVVNDFTAAPAPAPAPGPAPAPVVVVVQPKVTG